MRAKKKTSKIGAFQMGKGVLDTLENEWFPHNSEVKYDLNKCLKFIDANQLQQTAEEQSELNQFKSFSLWVRNKIIATTPQRVGWAKRFVQLEGILFSERIIISIIIKVKS